MQHIVVLRQKSRDTDRIPEGLPREPVISGQELEPRGIRCSGAVYLHLLLPLLFEDEVRPFGVLGVVCHLRSKGDLVPEVGRVDSRE